MIKQGTLAPGVILAGAVAAPLCILLTGLAHLYLQLPAPITIEWEALLSGTFMSLVPVLTIGVLISLPVNILGSAIMAGLSRRFEWARSKLSWIFAGTLAGAAVAWLIGQAFIAGEFAFGLIATSAVCAGLCRHWVEWSDAHG